ncbi:MAG: transcriptional regulator CynR [Pseudomonadota bacterium]
MDRNLVFPRSIRYLIAVADLQSFTRAAEMLFVSQPTLSQQIKQLEDLLDVQLLDRSGRNVRLTAAGEVYLRYARRALHELEEGKRAIHELQDLSRGSLRLGMTPITDHLVSPLLEYFNSRYPGITVSTQEMPQDAVETEVAEGTLDMGISFSNVLSTEARSQEIEANILFTETLNLAVGKTHPRAGQDGAMSVQALEHESLILLNSDFALRRHFDQYCREMSITPHIVMETNSLSVIAEVVRLGRLATILPNTIANHRQGLYPVMLKPEMPRHTVTLICRKGGYKSPACLAFGVLAALWCNSRQDIADDVEFQDTLPAYLSVSAPN